MDELKKKIDEKLNKILDNPKVKEIVEKTDAAIEKAKTNIKQIIESIKKKLGKPPKVCINDMTYL